MGGFGDSAGNYPADMAQSRVGVHDPALVEYLAAHSTPADDIQTSLIEVTQQATGDAAGMQIGVDQGVFLQIIARSIGARTAIEIGTFTGYSALSIVRGMGPGGRLICCDVSDEWTDIGRRHWEAAGVSEQIDLYLAPALDTLAALGNDVRFDLAFIDADKHNYVNYYEALLHRMSPTGLILVDNTLWGGQVANGEPDSRRDDPDDNLAAILAFNDHIAADDRVRTLILPLGDGVTVIQAK